MADFYFFNINVVLHHFGYDLCRLVEIKHAALKDILELSSSCSGM